MSGKRRNNDKLAMKDRMRKKLAVKTGSKKICLTMIVRNEAKNMPRLLDSVKSIIDMISIVDTGSTDNTKEVTMTWGKLNNIPTTVHHEPFKNFSYNRTHSATMAQKTYPEADYLLLSDADFVWDINVGNTFDKILLVDQKYLIKQYNKAISYWNVRLLSAKINWLCIGRTHEFWAEAKNQPSYSGEVRTTKITTLAIDDREDGGYKSDKFTRDERLLKEGLEDPDEPEDLKTRYKFYLAQTLKDMLRYEESIMWYDKRIEDGGWAEEVYYSKYQTGFCFEQMGWKKKHAVTLLGKTEKTQEDLDFLSKWNPKNLSAGELVEEVAADFTSSGNRYLVAYNYRKTRAEALYSFVRLNRSLAKNEIAYQYATLGKQIKYPHEDSLFIQDSCYEYLFEYEISIVANYIPKEKDEGRKAIAFLLEYPNLPDEIRNQTVSNSRFYI